MSKISAHVLDTARGHPVADLSVLLDRLDGHEPYRNIAAAVTNQDGRVLDLVGDARLAVGTYRVVFETAAYFVATQQPVFYPRVVVVFRLTDVSESYHIPLLLSPYGYSTYRGS
ncbi:MAG: hydroxyisourate hydrolase [Myxococcaceae bacterium]|nr:hydroxyisourate hydrolase [Myxococcaceae bacterium]